jgi:hypothetical protein
VSLKGLVLRPLRGVAGAFRSTRRTVALVPDVVEAILVLPTVSRQLEDVRLYTATLPEMLAEIERMRDDTGTLPLICEELERVQRNTLAVEQLAEVALPLQGAALRVGRFADRLPRRAQRSLTGDQ